MPIPRRDQVLAAVAERAVHIRQDQLDRVNEAAVERLAADPASHLAPAKTLARSLAAVDDDTLCLGL